jgi:hypothetical protein
VSLKEDDIRKLVEVYNLSISKIQKAMLIPQNAETLPDILEEEWMKFRFAD